MQPSSAPNSSSLHPDPPTPLRRLPVLLRRAWYGLNQAFRRRIAHTGCTPDQYIVLRNLAEGASAGLTQAELTRSMSSDPNTIASLLSRMEASGLVGRRADESDRRARRVRLKPLGERRFVELKEIATQLQRETLSVLDPADRTRFLRQLEAVAEACRLAAEA